MGDSVAICSSYRQELWKAQTDQLLRQGNQQSQTSQFEAAIQAWQQALTLYREIGDRLPEGQALYNLGGTLLQSGNLPAAKETLRDRSPIASPTVERIKQTAKAHQATLVEYSIIDASPDG